MRYGLTVNVPEEPDVSLWDRRGHEFVKTSTGKWRAKCYPEMGEYSWYSLLKQCGPLDDAWGPTQEWAHAKPGAYYWVRGLDAGRAERADGVGIASGNFMLVIPRTNCTGDLWIARHEPNDELTELTPVLAVPAETLTSLLNADDPEVASEYRDEMLAWLNSHKQKHWKDD